MEAQLPKSRMDPQGKNSVPNSTVKNLHPFKARVSITLVSISLIFLFLSLFFIYKSIQNNTPNNARATLIEDITPTQQVVKESEKLKEVIGFFPSWIPIENIEKSLPNLTQVIYFGLGVTSDGQIIKINEEGSPVIEWSIFTSSEFSDFKNEAQKKGKKVTVALKNFDNESIDTLISSTTATSRLTKELIKIAKDYGIDGFNLDFEYVTDTDFPTRIYFNRFISAIDEALDEYDPELTFSIDVNALATSSDAAYDMPKISEHVDHIIVMGYDYSRAVSAFAGPVAPLYGEGNSLSVSKTVTNLSGRINYEKVILGVPFYGYEWSTRGRSWGSATIPGSGALATYKRVKRVINENKNVKKYWDAISQGPWLEYVDGNAIKQIYYEDARSIAAKVGFVRDHSMAGIAIWAIGYEGDHQDIWRGIN